jgi:uncharacterized membrane protein
MSFGGYKKKSLNLSGALSAFVVGFVTFFVSFAFGLTLIWFFVSSSIITKIGKKRKRKIEGLFDVIF